MIRTRFAPSPTGELHIGGARTALFNFLFAHSEPDGRFILRIDDTDRERSRPEFEAWLMEDLRWLGLDWDDGPGEDSSVSYRQSERLPLYEAWLARLRETGDVYPCFCTEERLARLREEQARRGEPPRYDGLCRNLGPDDRARRTAELGDRGERPCWRFALPDRPVFFHDVVKGEMSFAPSSMGDFVVERSDGMPTYLFTSVVDDQLMEITHIIRGDEHLPNTARQQALFDALGWKAPAYAHIPMILSADRQKLSKRTGSTPIRAYRDRGFLPEALTAYLAGLSWSLSEGAPRFSLPELARLFSLSRLSSNPPVHDEAHLLHWQKEAMKRRGGALLREDLVKRESSFAAFDAAALISLLDDLLDEYPLLPELRDALEFLLRRGTGDPVELWMADLASELSALAPWSRDAIEASLRAFMKGRGLKGKEFFHPLRRVLTGCDKGAGLPLILEVLGRDEAAARLLGGAL